MSPLPIAGVSLFVGFLRILLAAGAQSIAQVSARLKYRRDVPHALTHLRFSFFSFFSPMQPIAAQTSKENRRQRFKGAGECQQQHRQPKEIQIEIDEKNHQKINEEIFFFLVFFFLLFVVLFLVFFFLLFVVVLLFLVAVASGAAGESVV